MTHDTNANATHVTSEAAFDLVPSRLLNFAIQFLSNKVLNMENGRAIADRHTHEQAILIGQHILSASSGMITSLAIGTAYHVYNETRSTQLLTILNMLKQSVSYYTFHCTLTHTCNTVMEKEGLYGICVPPNIRHGYFTYFFFDNIGLI
jgi:hypothetical protein